GVGGDELAVDHAAEGDSFGGRDHFRDISGEVVQSPVLHAHAAVALAEDKAAQTVPLDLEEVVGRAERSLGRGGLHRPQLRREVFELDLKLVWIGHVVTPTLSGSGSWAPGAPSVGSADTSPRK